MSKLKKVFSIFRKNGFRKGFKKLNNIRIRRNAFKEMHNKMPLVEKRMKDYFISYKDQTLAHALRKEERNIFVFWWDGFNNAPYIVKKCRLNLQLFYGDSFNIVEVDKNNYLQYTDIPNEVLKKFNQGKISIQTFSDVLRFNLLKNNGGFWFDSTILFTQKYDLDYAVDKLGFSTIEYNFSKQFFEYKGNSCSWSGFFIGAVKGNCLIKCLDQAMCTYLTKYKKRNPYFLIDMMFMMAKVYGIDDSILNKIEYTNEDMFYLMNHLNDPVTELNRLKVESIPQKTSWMLDESTLKKEGLGSYYFEVNRIEKE